MHLSKLGVRHFRRLSDVVIDLASDLSIFVGANNSGKTSVGHALQLFTGRGRFVVHDFSAHLWPLMNAFGERQPDGALPSIEIDIWFEATSDDLHRVIDLLPSLASSGSLVGMRVAFEPVDPDATQNRYEAARKRAVGVAADQPSEIIQLSLSPRNLHEYLRDRLHEEYEFRYYVLDPARFTPTMKAEEGYRPLPLTSRDRSGREILSSLLKVDFLHAQRHLSDGQGSARAEDLSRVLSRFYERNLEQKAEDADILKALTTSETALNEHLERVFEPTLRSLSKLGYPGLANPRLMIRSALNPAEIMSSRDGARVHYAIGPDVGEKNPPSLPDRYNGLGFKNLIFMVIELLDLHAQWLSIEENRPPLHLVFIEEPEAHLHAQLQQAFIRKVMELLAVTGDDRVHYNSQVVVTTHSSHIVYERGFRPIRYFRRSRATHSSISQVLNLSTFYDNTDSNVRTFLERYLKIAHCDLFFADAAVLVEGNVERLLLPHMIENAAPRLQSAYLTTLEIGGAFGYRFKTLIDFIGLTTLIITDLDSVFGPVEPGTSELAGVHGSDSAAGAAAGASTFSGDDISEEDADEEEGVAGAPARDEAKPGAACIAGHPNAATSNQTLLQWLPKCSTVADLWAASDEQKTQPRTSDSEALVRVAYQCRVEVTWRDDTALLAGRTFEEAFALENLQWCQHKARKSLQLRIPKAPELDLATLSARIYKRVQSSSFNKTDFALALLGEDPKAWVVPAYISQGLQWLESEIVPPVFADVQQHEEQGVEATTPDASAVAA